jgi:hypothetical protein
MKKFFIILSVMAVLLLTNAGMASGAGSAVYLGPLDTFKILDNQITALSSTDFINVQAAVRQKKRYRDRFIN